MTTEKDNRRRRWIYNGLLIFVVVAGILLVGLPQLHTRLFDRIHLLRRAAAGETRPDILSMGENIIPYPEEFTRSVSPENPNAPRSAILRSTSLSVEPAEPVEPVDTVRRRRLTVPSQGGTPYSDTQSTDSDADLTPRFQQGATEKEAFEKVLTANATLSGMMDGSNPQMRFKAWGAAHRGEGLYWVRVVFTSTAGTEDANDAAGKDVEYIWQVEDATDKVTALNFNARSL